MSDLTQGVLMLVIAIPSIVLHEVAHGYVAYRLGDPTAKSRGRLSLNPLKHVDPFGTVLLPIMLSLAGMPPFGFAKPVPINPGYFKDYRKGMLLTGLAGPSTNMALAVVAGLGVRALGAIGEGLGGALGAVVTPLGWVYVFLLLVAYFNLVLMFFNLIPVPPLDGSRVLPIFLSDRALRKYHEFERYGIMIVFGALLVLPTVFRIDVLGTYLDYTVDPLLQLLAGV